MKANLNYLDLMGFSGYVDNEIKRQSVNLLQQIRGIMKKEQYIEILETDMFPHI